VAAGHRGGAVVVGVAQWGRAPAWERRGELGEGQDVPGALMGEAFIGAGVEGSGRGGALRRGGWVMAALMALTPLKAGARLRGGRINTE
jgi:hypothetical protein